MSRKVGCLLCGSPFEPTRRWQRFCSASCRTAAWKGSDLSLLRAERACTYCGVPSDTVDHVPPSIVRPTIIEFGWQGRYPFTTVPACRECNSALTHRGGWTVASRKAFMKQWIARRYAKYLRIREWDDHEINDLGHSLQEHVVTGLAIQALTRERINY